MLPARRKKSHLTLEEVQALFERWRKEKKGRDPIPPSLWEAAVSLTDEHTMNRVARFLHLNHTELKSRSTLCRGSGDVAFIELDPITVATECTIEMVRPTGERMRIRGACNVAGLVREFFR
jgi:hypothetical protein